MYLTLIRQYVSARAVQGTLWQVNHQQGNTLLCATLENASCLIPELMYPVSVTMSPKFGRLLPLLNHVPRQAGTDTDYRAGIRMHAGNSFRDSSGCILVGEAVPNRQDDAPTYRLMNSRPTEAKITDLLLSAQRRGEPIYLSIDPPQIDWEGYPYVSYDPRAVVPECAQVLIGTEDCDADN